MWNYVHRMYMRWVVMRLVSDGIVYRVNYLELIFFCDVYVLVTCILIMSR